MRMRVLLFCAVAACLVARAEDDPKTDPKPVETKSDSAFKNQKEKQSYAIGLAIANNLKDIVDDIDLNVVMMGIKDGLPGGKKQMPPDEVHEVMAAFQKEMMATTQDRMKKISDRNAKEGAEFLAANKDKPGVKVTESGLQYKVLKDGTGETPKETDTVTCNYRGTFINGEEFDSSYSRGKPAAFKVTGVIKGWTEALKMMKVGSKWQLYIPAALAYGANGFQSVPPNATLIFDIELMAIGDTTKETAPPAPEMKMPK